MIIKAIQESCIHLFQTNHLVKYGLLIKTLEMEEIEPLDIEDKINITLVIN